MVKSKYLLWAYVVHIFADCKAFNDPVLAELRQYSYQVLIISYKQPITISEPHC